MDKLIDTMTTLIDRMYMHDFKYELVMDTVKNNPTNLNISKFYAKSDVNSSLIMLSCRTSAAIENHLGGYIFNN